MATIIPPSKPESLFRSLTYFLLGSVGVLVSFYPPVSIELQIGILTQVWGVCLTVSFVAAIGSWLQRYRVEYSALPLTITGALIYAYTVWSIVPETITRLPQAVIITAIAMMLITRIITLHRLVNSWRGKSWTGS